MVNTSEQLTKSVDDLIYDCTNIADPKSFFLFAGAGSGKTRSLVNVLKRLKDERGSDFRSRRQQVAIITYTNGACDEIKSRLDFDPLFSVSTIHSFIWELIKDYQSDIKNWLRLELTSEIEDLKEQQKKGRPGTKAAAEREQKIASKTKRIESLDKIRKFTYNPNTDNRTKDSLNHSEVIKLGAYFLLHRPLMQQILVSKFPILFIDESQDTKKELVDAFFEVQRVNKSKFSLGLFGDTMQRIYSDGKENLGQTLPSDWIKPAKQINYRCPRRVIKLINKIREGVDGQMQIASTNNIEGIIRLFILPADVTDKMAIENAIAAKMATIADDNEWNNPSEVKILILEHHMAASRMGFSLLFDPLYQVDSYRTGVIDGSLSELRFFTELILPILQAKRRGDDFGIARTIKQHSSLFDPIALKDRKNQVTAIQEADAAVKSLFGLWKENDPTLLEIVKLIDANKLFSLPENLSQAAIFATRNKDEESEDEELNAWTKVLKATFTEVEQYAEYVSDRARFGTHQGVKGREFPRVMVILDDAEARGFLFSYDKILGAKGMTTADQNNIAEGKETSLDRTTRLFYVACSRAEKSLSIVAYTANKDAVLKHVQTAGWFTVDEIEVITP